MKRTGTKSCILVAKVSDDILVEGTRTIIYMFVNELNNAFDVGKISIGGNLRFNGCEIDTARDYTELSMPSVHRDY